MKVSKADRAVVKTKPKSGESEQDFVSRCISEAADDHPDWEDDKKQAVCYSIYRESKKTAKARAAKPGEKRQRKDGIYEKRQDGSWKKAKDIKEEMVEKNKEAVGEKQVRKEVEEKDSPLDKSIMEINKAIISVSRKKIPVAEKKKHIKDLLFKKLEIYKAELKRFIEIPPEDMDKAEKGKAGKRGVPDGSGPEGKGATGRQAGGCVEDLDKE